MNKYPIIADNFLPDPMHVRASVIKQGFRDFPFEDTIYHTVNVDYTCMDFKDGLERIFARPIEIHVQAFRQGKYNSPLHNYVHADNTCANMAAVVYLNPPEQCFGGTAFWQHKKTGWTQMPTKEVMEERQITLEEFGKDWHKPAVWEMVKLCQMRWNRAICYPTTYFHSRWPWKGFGKTDEDARLVWAGFYDVL